MCFNLLFRSIHLIIYYPYHVAFYSYLGFEILHYTKLCSGFQFHHNNCFIMSLSSDFQKPTHQISEKSSYFAKANLSTFPTSFKSSFAVLHNIGKIPSSWYPVVSILSLSMLATLSLSSSPSKTGSNTSVL